MNDVTNESIVERIQAGDTDAIRVLWERNKGLISKIAKRYTSIINERGDCDFDDLMQVGFFGIHRAADEYSPERGAKFSTFAVFFIKREMRRTLGILTSKRDASLYADPLDAPLYGDGHNTTLLDSMAAPEDNENTIEQEELRAAVHAAVGRMKNDAARRTIEACYFAGTSTAQQAEAEDTSQQNINERLHKGYRELYHDPELHSWAVDYEYTNLHRHKGVRAFKSSRSSVVEDIVLQAEDIVVKVEERQNKRAALYEALGSLV